jgi:hypothetical protein
MSAQIRKKNILLKQFNAGNEWNKNGEMKREPASVQQCYLISKE